MFLYLFDWTNKSNGNILKAINIFEFTRNYSNIGLLCGTLSQNTLGRERTLYCQVKSALKTICAVGSFHPHLVHIYLYSFNQVQKVSVQVESCQLPFTVTDQELRNKGPKYRKIRPNSTITFLAHFYVHVWIMQSHTSIHYLVLQKIDL